jgi:3-phosphoshikimate 1-carboxyvinyltransferase
VDLENLSAASKDVYRIAAGRPLGGRLRVPASKSLTQRYFDLALVGRRRLTVRHPLRSEDPELFLGALAQVGFRLEERPDEVEIVPGEVAAGGEIFCGNGGTMFRFLTAALTTLPGTWRLDGVPRLRERPVGPLVDALRELGAAIDCPGREGYAPLTITGGTLRGGRARLDAGA